ncbi:MAG: energy-coupling factor ABC transporter permease [bacterium]
MHISDGILSAPTCAAGYVAAAGLVAVGLRRAGQADSARAGMLTAAFFLASLIRFPLPGTSVHLLLASLNGIALGTLCFPSIFLALLLQALLLGHGGLSSLGVNTVIMAVPAYVAGVVFHQGIKKGSSGWLVFFSTVLGVMVLGSKLCADALLEAGLMEWRLSWLWAFLIGGAAAALVFVVFRFGKKPELVHRWGFASGALAVLGSALLFYLVLSFAPLAAHAARQGFVELARVAFVFHVPVILVEGIVVALLVRYLDTVTPELLRVKKPAAGAVLLVLALTLCWPAASKAHAVGADASVTDGTVTVEVWTDGGDIPSSGKVTVLNPDGSVAFEGNIENGKWSFEPDTARSFKFVVDIGHGHGKAFTLHPSELAKLEKSLAGNKKDKSIKKPKDPKQSEQKPVARHRSYSTDTWVKALTGVLVIGLLSCFIMIRNLRREVESLKKRLDKHD